MELVAVILEPVHGLVNWLNDLDEGAFANLIMWATMLYAIVRLESRNAALMSELRKSRTTDKD